MKSTLNLDKKRFSFLDRDPYAEQIEQPELSPKRESPQATVIFSDSNADNSVKSPNNDDNLYLKSSQTTLTEETTKKSINMTRARLLAIMFTLSLGSFLSMLDQSILGSALPAITNQFGELSSIAWVSAAYMLTFTALQSIFSKVSEIFGRMPVLVISLTVFSAGSAICGAASTMDMLIAGRAIAGCGGCGVSTMVQVILIDLLPLHKRATYMSYMSFTSTLAVVAGPLIGGAITDHWVWRWCFYLNIPICAVIAAICLLTIRVSVPAGTTKEKFARIDFLGAFLLLAGLVLFILALNWGGKDYKWNSAAVIVTLVLSVILLAAFIYVEHSYASEPIITMRMFTSRTLTPALVSQFFLGAGITFTVLYLPVYFTVVFGASSTTAGLYMLPYLIGMMVTGLIMGPLVTRFNIYRPFIWVGLAMMTLAAGLLNIIQPDTRLVIVLVLIGIFGIGSGIGMLPLMIATQASCQPRDTATAATLALHLRNVGSIVGIAVVGTIFNNSLISSMSILASEYPRYSSLIYSSINDATIVWNGMLPFEVHSSVIFAYVSALKAIFIANAPFVGMSFLLSLPIKHFSLKQRAPPATSKSEIQSNDANTNNV
ncbi:MFS general substrate transporter [Coemansia reversa NRRL 1564]|uniref:MFS general substrate transporter n=1 Tax=Coemansia reversa (strain ATCC 12441 / NRRL 1564) TaxID=763665 RepID=A0A2G5BDS7_COERN|nr:MFS general substrate transporter [Coemansia reversa NRRL 1564]|eukprot:PIA17169.1 MFS general substrate transporter [Coemansia reversa NRRL 1564]